MVSRCIWTNCDGLGDLRDLRDWGRRVYSQPRGPPRDQTRPRAWEKPSPRLAAMVVLMTSSGWPSVVTSNRFKLAPRSKLENLTGFFSSLVPAAGPETAVVVAAMTW